MDSILNIVLRQSWLKATTRHHTIPFPIGSPGTQFLIGRVPQRSLVCLHINGSRSPNDHHPRAGETPKLTYQPKPFHASLVLRCRGVTNCCSVPPSLANLLALSRAINASRPSLTSEVPSLIPVSSAAFSTKSSSMFSVVLMPCALRCERICASVCSICMYSARVCWVCWVIGAWSLSDLPAFGGVMWPREQDFSAETIYCELQE